MPPKSVKVKLSPTGGVKRTRSSSPPPTPPRKDAAKRSPRSQTPSPNRSATTSTSISAAAVAAIAMPLEETKKTERSIWSAVEPFIRRTAETDFEANRMFKFITWNVAGLRGLLRKNGDAIQHFLQSEQPDLLCLQETKLNPDDPHNSTLGQVPGYSFVDHACRAKKGYSGTRTYIRDTLANGWELRTLRGFALPNAPPDADDGDNEGRVLTTYFGEKTSVEKNGQAGLGAISLALVNTYVPNSGMTLDRLPYRYKTFDVQMRQHLLAISECCRPLASHTDASPLTGFIWTGDLNVAERDYDRYFAGNYKAMQKCSGFTPEERASFRETLQITNSVDTFRMLYPRAGPVYTFWSARINGRSRGLGWRLDYFVVSAALAQRVVDCFTMPQVIGSDHCPVQMWLRR